MFHISMGSSLQSIWKKGPQTMFRKGRKLQEKKDNNKLEGGGTNPLSEPANQNPSLPLEPVGKGQNTTASPNLVGHSSASGHR